MAERYKPTPLRLTLEKMLKKAMSLQVKNERDKERLAWREKHIEKDEAYNAAQRSQLVDWSQVKTVLEIFHNLVGKELAQADESKTLENIRTAYSDLEKRLHAIKGNW